MRPAEARAAAEDQRENSDQADGEEELGQVSRARQELKLELLGLREKGTGAWTPESEGGGDWGLDPWV